MGEDSTIEYKEVFMQGKYVRSPSRDSIADEMAAFANSRSRLLTFDEFPVIGIGTEALQKEKWIKFKTDLSPKDETEFLVKMRLLAFDEDKNLCPTVAGVLMTADEPQQYLRNAYIQAVAYRTTQRDAIQQYDARDITGTLDQQIYEACQFVARNMRIGATKKMGRIDVPQYEMSAIFEAITNAVAHRDYAIHGAAIRLHMFSDRLEIYSPGAIPNSMSVETLPLRQFSRNPLLTSLLARCSAPRDFSSVGQWLDRTHIMDRRGEGVPIILQKSRELSGKMPTYEVIGEDELKLTIYAADPQQLFL
jgi:predicted HTH transcriptional regulator